MGKLKEKLNVEVKTDVVSQRIHPGQPAGFCRA
jgi:hypothetical protein